MDKKEEKTNKEEYKGGIIHSLLVYVYLVFLIAVILGSIFDILIETNLFFGKTYNTIGVLALVVGSLLIYWAQRSSRLSGEKRRKEVTTESFKVGPYRFIKHPSYFGVFIMSLGLALIMGSFFSVILSVITYIIIRTVFVKKEEQILSNKFGEPYEEYKNQKRKRP